MPTSIQLHFLASVSAVFNFIRYSLPGGRLLWVYIDTVTLVLIDFFRLFAGRYKAKNLSSCPRPHAPLILYEYEGCPYCRKVRETLSVLDIDHYVFPCPRDSLKSSGTCLNSRFRPEVSKVGGQLKFPFLIDPSTGRNIYESDTIISYLWDTYGTQASQPLNYRLAHWPPYRDLSMKMCMILRPCPDMGFLRSPSRQPSKPLELWGHESSAPVRRVRETLCLLEIPYYYHTIPVGSVEKRNQLNEIYASKHKEILHEIGAADIPYLHDPNTNTNKFDGSEISLYLIRQYQTFSAPYESWLDFGSAEKKIK